MTEKTEVKGNGSGTYEEFLNEMKESGMPIQDAADIMRDGQGLLIPPEEKHTNAALLGSVPGSDSLYEKNDKTKGKLLDLMARTNFRNHNEMIYFMDWVEWCEDFGVPLDGPMRYVVAVTSQGGLSREQYVDAITTQRFRNFGGSNGNHKSGIRQGKQEGLLP